MVLMLYHALDSYDGRSLWTVGHWCVKLKRVLTSFISASDRYYTPYNTFLLRCTTRQYDKAVAMRSRGSPLMVIESGTSNSHLESPTSIKANLSPLVTVVVDV